MLQIKNPVPVAKIGDEREQSLWLIASKDDLDAGNTNGPAQTFDARFRSFSKVAWPLQQWFKFGMWQEVDRSTPLPFAVSESA